MPIIIRILVSLFFLITGTHLFAQPLKIEEVFHPAIKVIGPNALGIQVDIHSGVFLYADKIAIQKAEGVQLGSFRLPKAALFKNQQGKEFLVYRHQLKLKIPVLGMQQSGRLTFYYQGCAEDGFCYPPQSRVITASFNPDGGLVKVAWQTPSLPITNHQDSVFADKSVLLIAATFLLFGILLSFTPCVLPMIPVLMGILSGQSHPSTRQGLILGIAYTLGIATSYSLVGAVFAYFGQNVQSYVQSPLAIGSFAALFVFLAFSSMGFVKMTLPSFLQTKVSRIHHNLPKQNFFGAFLMGVLSTLILSPCVTPPLVGAIGFMVQTGNIYLGAFSLFCMGIGIGLPLIAISTAAGRYLPRAGQWMESIRVFLSYILLGVAVFLVCKLLNPIYGKMLVGLYLFFGGIGFGVFRPKKQITAALLQGLALLIMLYGIFLMLGASLGSASYWHPLGQLHSEETKILPYETTVQTPEALDNALAQTQGHWRVLFFTADWCSSCAMQKNALKARTDLWKKHDVRFIFVDITKQTAENKALEARFGVIAPPTLVLLDNEGLPHSPNFVGDESAFEMTSLFSKLKNSTY